jgi:hypothetical protein
VAYFARYCDHIILPLGIAVLLELTAEEWVLDLLLASLVVPTFPDAAVFSARVVFEK